MAYHDSPAVIALIEKLDRHRKSHGARSSWGLDVERKIKGQIRYQRLSDARMKATHTKEEWDALVAEFGGRCVICGCEPHGGPTKDHILSVVHGGSDGINNIQPVCRQCNSSKGATERNWLTLRRTIGFPELLA